MAFYFSLQSNPVLFYFFFFFFLVVNEFLNVYRRSLF